jgi:hypothetical protein
MKKLFILVIIFHSISILPNEPDEIETIPCIINFNVNFSNATNTALTNDANINSHQNQSQIDSNSVGIPLSIQSLQSSLKAYKWHIATALAVGSYGLLCYYLIKGNSYLKRSDLWSSWRKELSLDELLALPHQQFTQDVCKEMQNRYSKDFTSSVILFMKAIEQEERDIRWYRSLYEWATFFYMRKLTPCDTAAYESCTQRLQRLAYYKGCLDTIWQQRD